MDPATRNLVLGVTARNGQQSTLRVFVNDLTKENAPEFDYSSLYEETAPETNCLMVDVRCFS
jgi:hypothetical protein